MIGGWHILHTVAAKEQQNLPLTAKERMKSSVIAFYHAFYPNAAVVTYTMFQSLVRNDM